ncbi:MAG: hypothetical protein IKV21_04180 [Clostridia bacterium]|nr:hypothetical protein [Clostridia bacterium]
MLERWQRAGFIFTGVTGVLLHFLYEWTDESLFVAAFSAVNESTWEHMKLLFVPLFVFTFIEESFMGKDYGNFMWAKAVGTVAGLLTVPFLYYTYKGALGLSADWFNIAIFFIAAAVTFITETRIMKRELSFPLPSAVAEVILFALAFAFVILTFMQPEIPLFEDPLTKGYGIPLTLHSPLSPHILF